MMEVIRRIIMLGGLTVGLWMCFWATPSLFRVTPRDWEHERHRIEKKSAVLERFAKETLDTKENTGIDSHPETRLGREDFIAHQTRDRLITVSGPEWEGFFTGAADTVLGNAVSSDWRKRKALWPYDDSIYFRMDEAPLKAIAVEFSNQEDALRYVQIKGKDRSEYLLVQRSSRNDLFSHAPSHLVFPYRAVGVGCILLAFLIYALLPWPRRPAEGIYYTRARAIVGPDVTGCIIGGAFFVIPIMIPQANSGDSPFSPGWNILTAVLWLVAAITFTSCAVAAWYTAKQIELTEEGLRYTALNARFSRRWDEVERVEPFDCPMIPRWLRYMLFALSFLNWRALGPALMFGGRETGIRLLFKDGKSITFLLKGLSGAVPFVGRFASRGIPVAPEVYRMLGKEPSDPAFRAPFPAKASAAGFAVFSTIAAILLLAALGLSWPLATPAITSNSLPEKAFALPAESDPGITWETIRKENEILAEIKGLRPRMDQITERMKKATRTEQKVLQEESDQIMKKIKDLRKQFEEVRKPAANAPASDAASTEGRAGETTK